MPSRNYAHIQMKDDECQYSLTELLNFTSECLDDYNCYTAKHLKAKLLEHYGDIIIITSIIGKSNISSFRDTSHKILLETWNMDKTMSIDEKRKHTVKMAASIVRDDIRTTLYDCDNYPDIQST